MAESLVGTATPSDDAVKSSDDQVRENADESPPSTDENDEIQKSEAREERLQLLSQQLLYYLSSQNLPNDTYLKTIMELNSDHVPLLIVSNFSNIKRIIASNLVDGETVSSLDMPDLVRKAAFMSEFLEVVVLDRNGKIVANVDDENHELESGQINFYAIGPTSVRPTDYDTHKPLRRDKKQDSGEEVQDDSANIIIFRDVHEDATDDDIREILSKTLDASLPITDVRREVENCWFVTLGRTKNRSDMVDILLSLRNMKICDKPIKARLKTQRMPTKNTPPDSPTRAFNPYKPWSRSKPGGFSSKGYGNQIYTGDRVNYGLKKQYNSEKGRRFASGGGYNKNSRFHKGNADLHSNENIDNNGLVDCDKENIQKEDIILPPPSCELNFPSLGGNSVKLPTGDSEKGTADECAVDNVCDKESAPSFIVPKEPVTPNRTGGYAAALRKSAPNGNKITSNTKIDPIPTLERKRLVPRHEPTINSTSNKSLGTTATDDASTDDKSSLSSKPESEKSANAGNLSSRTIVTTPVISVGWGRGPSFAQIVKKQEPSETKSLKN